ncbi:transcriptional regulator NrdR [Neomegalonema sp.]|uniref:transcriptional regulator NrdR n=1 Tax=Neomegalonema sp. TaxID=2039713 RepID=UPI00261D9024|nr:transcriptional regulator NrdR [Neomegalonema sp.]MDD2867551.1 transcriptional regulator NrdR [Neomegalonema sp.]
MRCPFCAEPDTQVKDSRPAEDQSAIRRRRVCPSCGARFTTYERAQLREVMVRKKDGGREPFDREKLARSLRIAMRKRPLAEERIDQLVSGLARRVETLGESEIASGKIGEMAMEALSDLDAVAYVRFASVYKDFNEAADFEDFAAAIRHAAEESKAAKKPS